jgi:anti-anti-sigma regulatory factor
MDLAAVDYTHSSAVAMLLMLCEKAQTADKTVVLSNCPGRRGRSWRAPTSASRSA